MRYSTRCIGMAVAVVLVAVWGAFAANQTVPYVDMIESYTTGDPLPTSVGWSYATGVGTSAVTVVNDVYVEGGKAAYIRTNALKLNVANALPAANYTNVWIQMWAKPSMLESDPTASALSAAFYLRTGGTIRAYSGAAWTSVKTGVPTNKWLGFVVHMDYNNRKWDLFMNTNGIYSNRYVKVNPTLLSMATVGSSNRLYQVVVDVGTRAWVDAVAISKAHVVAGIQGYSNLLVRTVPPAGVTSNVVLNVGTHDAAENSLAQRLGLDLLSGYTADDELRVYTTNGWNRSKMVAGPPAYWTWVEGSDPENIHVGLCTAAKVVRGGSAATALQFLGYNERVNLALGAAERPIVTRDGHPATFGWLRAVWPYSDRAPNGGLGLGFAATEGDMIHLYRFISGRWQYLRWFWGPNSSWRQGAGYPTTTLRNEETFWYKSKNPSADVPWYIDLVAD